MTGKQIAAIAALAVVIVAAIVAVGVRSCAASNEAAVVTSSTTAATEDEKPSTSATSSTRSEEEIVAEIAKGDGTEPQMSQVAGLEEADWLTEREKEQVIESIRAKFWSEGHYDERNFEIVGDHSDKGDLKELYIKDLSDGKTYLMNVGARYGMYEVTYHVEGLNDEEYEELAAGTKGMDEYSDLTSSETEFDTQNSVPLSYRDKVSKLLPDAVAERLLADINSAIEPYGGHVEGEINIMVAKDVQDSGDSTKFRVMAYSGIDKVVIECEYANDGKPGTFTIMP